jgi:hypothetical protein
MAKLFLPAPRRGRASYSEPGDQAVGPGPAVGLNQWAFLARVGFRPGEQSAPKGVRCVKYSHSATECPPFVARRTGSRTENGSRRPSHAAGIPNPDDFRSGPRQCDPGTSICTVEQEYAPDFFPPTGRRPAAGHRPETADGKRGRRRPPRPAGSHTPEGPYSAFAARNAATWGLACPGSACVMHGVNLR